MVGSVVLFCHVHSMVTSLASAGNSSTAKGGRTAAQQNRLDLHARSSRIEATPINLGFFVNSSQHQPRYCRVKNRPLQGEINDEASAFEETGVELPAAKAVSTRASMDCCPGLLTAVVEIGMLSSGTLSISSG